MKFFIDTANIEKIKEIDSIGILDGVTTNPSLVAKEEKSFKELVKQISAIMGNRPVSAEVISLETEGMIKEAREVASWGKNIVVKIPMTLAGLKATSALKKEGIRANVTLVFSVNQAILAAKAGAYFVSPFVGRLDDIGDDGIAIVQEIADIYSYYEFDSEIISASIRNPLHVIQSAHAGAHIATVPYEILMRLFKHPLTDIGIERFLADWNKAGLKIQG